jgi:hypothetical protein
MNSVIKPKLGIASAHQHDDRPIDPDLLPLPWRGEYGSFLKGGTPAILVDGHYLSFFHTESSHTTAINTYYMGAITFCPQFPYEIHSISECAIMGDDWYEEEWSHSSRDYVVFPWVS